MTNAEKFKTAKERKTEWEKYCEECYHDKTEIMDKFDWLEKEYKGELKRCPFCGAEAVLIEDKGVYNVLCTGCGLHLIQLLNQMLRLSYGIGG